MSTIRFIGHNGEISTVARLHPKSMFVLDANTVLTLLQHISSRKQLNEKHIHLLRETRRRVRHQWIARSKFIPVDPVLALMELTRQDREPNYENYLEKFESFFNGVYKIDDYDRNWTFQTYKSVYRLVSSTHSSLEKTLQQIQIFAPTVGTLKQTEILTRIDAFLEWLVSERKNLAIIGGPLIQLAVTAIAGSPEAHRFLKLNRVPKEGNEAVSKNVAWDLMHWMNLDFHYYYAKYPSTIVCTSDQALADFLLSRKNLSPRLGRTAFRNSNIIDAYGIITTPKLSRLDDTRLGEEVNQRILEFWKRMERDLEGEIYFTPFKR